MSNKFFCKPCFAFDALGAFIFNGYCRNDIPEIKQWIESKFKGIDIDPSNAFFDILLLHHSLDEIEQFDLAKLVTIYPKYICEDKYVRRFENEIIKSLQILQEANFTAFWTKQCYPIIKKQCSDFTDSCNPNIIHNILNDICKLKQQDYIQKIHIYMTYFTWPVSFHLSTNSYLTNCPVGDTIYPNGIMQMFAHELSHKFSNEKSRKAYQEACIKDPYLHRTNWFLSNIVGSPGDEEEFVVAIEHTIAVKNGLETYEQACYDLFHRYKSCMPISILLFFALCKLDTLPEDMNDWIYSKFHDGTITAGNIADIINISMPGYIKNFNKFWIEEKEKSPKAFTQFEDNI